MNTSKQIAIIGGGPAGLMAAEVLADAGHQVTIYDRMPTVGRKFLMAGRGGLNLTHSEPLEQFLTRYAEASDWLAPSIRAFPPDSLRAWCEGLGQDTFVGSSGRVFPRTMKAAPLLRAWLTRLSQLKVAYAPRHNWQGFLGDALHFSDAQGKDVLVTPDATLLTMGGASWPRLGSDGHWVDILGTCGVAIAPLRPANGGFVVPWSDYIGTRFAGMPLKAVRLRHQGVSHQGDIMITQQGIEGGAVYALGSGLRASIEHSGTAFVELDLRPAMALQTLTKKMQLSRGRQSLSTYLHRCGFSPLAIGLLREVTPPAQLAVATPALLAARLKALPIRLTATTGLARSISTAGGITRDSVQDDFMLRAKPGVFVAGEMLDWEAPTGGYLLQGCFSTAVTAARGIIAFCSGSS